MQACRKMTCCFGESAPGEAGFPPKANGNVNEQQQFRVMIVASMTCRDQRPRLGFWVFQFQEG
jgi:hypothetical protein